jgi:CDP-diacylglycerol--serine O-phosphatidyltransferase
VIGGIGMRRFPASPEVMAARQARRRKMIGILPSLLTLGNAVFGFACITYAAKVGPESAGDTTMYLQLHFAAWMIFGALVCDGLDGPLARLAKQTSDFGANLDSLADAISFGVAPAFLMLKFSTEISPVYPPRLLWVIAVLYMLFAVVRLARFNISKNDAKWRGAFCGLPSPAAAATVASLVIIGPGLMKWTRPEGEFLLRLASYSLPIVTFCVAVLMVSRVPYPKLAEMLRSRRSYRHLINFIFVLGAVFTIHELAVPLVMICYVAGAPLKTFWFTAVLRRPPEEPRQRPPTQ